MGFIHFLQLILIVMILLAVGIPLFGELKLKKLVEPVDPAIDEFKHLLVRKEETLISIKELEFDYNTGKISEPDYKELLHKLEMEATGILEHLDQLKQKRKKRQTS
jgi:Sec-independent protein translocase protein TatA